MTDALKNSFVYVHLIVLSKLNLRGYVSRYGYSKERFVWSLISAVGIFCLGSGATIVHGVQNLWTSQVTGHRHLLGKMFTSSL